MQCIQGQRARVKFRQSEAIRTAMIVGMFLHTGHRGDLSLVPNE
jgi:hypothetical protein